MEEFKIMINKETVIRVLIALGMLGVVIFTTLFFVNYESKVEKVEVDYEMELDSEIVSVDPKVSASNFIRYNGTMGDLSKVSQDYFDNQVVETNPERRMAAFVKVKDAVIPDSPILTGREEEAIERQTSDFPVFYEADELKVGEPSDVRPLRVEHDTIGPVEYESVEVNIDFTSSQHTFYWPTDTGGDSRLTQKATSEEFEDITVTLVKSGDLWFIYDVENIEYDLNVRMATWSGRGEDTVTVEQEVVGYYDLNYNDSREDEKEENADE